MIATVWQLLHWLFGRGDPDEGETDDGDDEGGFAFSLLDASVQYSHGQNTGAEAVRELQQANERAAELESARERDR